MRIELAAVLLFSAAASAATVDVHVTRNGAAVPLDVRIGRIREARAPEWLAVRQLGTARSDVRFSELQPGAYTVLVAGPAPLQRAAAHTGVAANDTRRVDIAIHPRPLHGRIMLGSAPLDNATVTLRCDDFETSAKTNAYGMIGGTFWQGGDFAAILDAPRLGAALPLALRIAEGGFDLHLESRVVRGIVRGTAGEPVANAAVILRSGDGERVASRRAETDARGAFRIDAVAPGPQSLLAAAPGYLRGEPVTFTLDKGEQVQNLAVDPGIRRTIAVTGPDGQPLPDAVAVCSSGNTIHSLTWTDALGRAVVAMPRDGSAMLYVVPQGGSIVAQRLTRGADVVRLQVPASSASLQLDALVTDGKPLANVSLLLRYNGTIIPPQIARVLRDQQQLELVTDDRGRVVLPHVAPGRYEVWPYRSAAEAESLLAAESALTAPIRLDVTPGANRATVRFKPRH